MSGRSESGTGNTQFFEDQYITAKAIGVLVRAFQPCIQFVSGMAHSQVELDGPEANRRLRVRGDDQPVEERGFYQE